MCHSRDVICIKFDDDDTVDPLFALALLNSRLITWYHHKRNPKAQKGLFPKVLVSDLSKLPFPVIDLSKKSDKVQNDNIISLADQMIKLKQKEFAEPNQKLKTMIARQIEGVARQTHEYFVLRFFAVFGFST